jgi:hypothetical protein
MTALSPDEYAAQFEASLRVADASTSRTIQSVEGVIGISDLGYCQEQTRRTITKAPRTDSPKSLAAMIGNWVDYGVKAAREATSDVLLNVPLIVKLPNGAEIPGTADEIDPDEPAVCDVKTKHSLAAIRRGHATQQNRWQKHLYGAAAIQAGIVKEDGLVVRNVWLDRSGRDHKPHVEQEPFSWDVVGEASAWLDDVMQAVLNDSEALKEPPRNECRDWCVFYTACRGPEVELGPITNPRLAGAVDMYAQAAEDKRLAESIMDALGPDVENVSGRTEQAEIVSTQVNRKTGPTVSVTARLL